MAKRGTKVLPARKEYGAGRDDDSLLVRSAESLGRVIGSLQRQTRGGAARVSSVAGNAIEAARKASGRKAKTTRKKAAARKTSKKR